MADTMKMRATLKGDVAEVKVLMSHPMESGLRKDAKTDKVIPANYIKNVSVAVNGKPVMQAEWSGAVSKNPFLGFRLKGVKAGDRVTISTVDNQGAKQMGELAIN